MSEQPQIDIVPITLPVANRFVAQLHRHHAPLPGGFAWFCLGAVADEVLTSVAIAGRPTNRNNDDGQTIEVLRIAADGTPNAPSALLGACGRVGRAMGASRVITYTLDSESGSSLKGAGWVLERSGIRSWWTAGTSRTPAVDRPHMNESKSRWALNIRPPIPYSAGCRDEAAETAQTSLFEVDHG